ncbi:MAG: hypothetical protein ACL93V_00660 [Candidatus Electrothrix sp. YB6]
MQQNETVLDTSAKIELSRLSTMDTEQRQQVGQQLRSQKIFFAHMSVGYNIIEGLKQIGEQYPELKLNIVKTEDPAEMAAPGFYHTPLGFNTDPGKKIDSFQEKIDKIRSAEPDIAFMKLCYVDINASRKLELLFERYAQEIDQLEKKNPGIRFLHWTCPLTSSPMSLKGQFKQTIKFITGKPTGTDNNLARFEWNKKIIERYTQDEIFDLAKYESHTPGGELVYQQSADKKIPAMAKEYTNDSGHLNREGQIRIAEQLLFFLAAHIRE